MKQEQAEREYRETSVRIPMKRSGHKILKQYAASKGIDVCSLIRISLSEKLKSDGVPVTL